MIDRAPPSDVGMEYQVLGAMLHSPGKAVPEARLRLSADDFYDQRNSLVYTAAVEVWHDLGALDLALLSDRLRASGQLDEAGGYFFLADLATGVASWANVRLHAARVREHAVARRAIARLSGGIASLYDSTATTAQLRQCVSDLRQLVDDAEQEEDESAASLVMRDTDAAYQEVRALAAAGRTYAGMDSGFRELNDTLNGLCRGELTVLGGDTSTGKSTLAKQIAYAVMRAGGPVGYITQEEPRERVGMRMACLAAGSSVDPNLARRGKLGPSSLAAFGDAMGSLSRLPWWVYDQARTMDQVEHEMRSRTGVALWVIDHLHRTRGRGENVHEQLTDVVERCKDLALELDCHVLLPAQLHRVKDRPDRRPRLEDLRGSGSIEEHADNVLLIYRPGRYDHLREGARKKDLEAKGDGNALRNLLAEVLILAEKTRYGPIGTVPLTWRSDVALFADLARFEEPASDRGGSGSKAPLSIG